MVSKTKPVEGASRAEGRPERIPVSGQRNITTVHNTDPAFVYRWVNDVEDRISRFKLGGWEHVEGAKVGDRTVDNSGTIEGVVSKNVGSSRVAYLMRINRMWYEEDQANKAALIKEQEDAMLRNEKSAEGRYGKVSIK